MDPQIDSSNKPNNSDGYSRNANCLTRPLIEWHSRTGDSVRSDRPVCVFFQFDALLRSGESKCWTVQFFEDLGASTAGLPAQIWPGRASEAFIHGGRFRGSVPNGTRGIWRHIKFMHPE